MEKNETIARRCCFIDEQENGMKQLMDGVVSSMNSGEEMEDCSVSMVGREKSVEQWCFSIEKKNDEELLAMVFQQRKKMSKVLKGGGSASEES
jgi:hypothetical protein